MIFTIGKLESIGDGAAPIVVRTFEMKGNFEFDMY